LDDFLALGQRERTLGGRGLPVAPDRPVVLDLVGALEPSAKLGLLGLDLGNGLGDPGLELGGLAAELVLREGLVLLGVGVDLVDEGLELRYLARVAVAAEQLLDDVEHGGREGLRKAAPVRSGTAARR